MCHRIFSLDNAKNTYSTPNFLVLTIICNPRIFGVKEKKLTLYPQFSSTFFTAATWPEAKSKTWM